MKLKIKRRPVRTSDQTSKTYRNGVQVHHRKSHPPVFFRYDSFPCSALHFFHLLRLSHCGALSQLPETSPSWSKGREVVVGPCGRAPQPANFTPCLTSHILSMGLVSALLCVYASSSVRSMSCQTSMTTCTPTYHPGGWMSLSILRFPLHPSLFPCPLPTFRVVD